MMVKLGTDTIILEYFNPVPKGLKRIQVKQCVQGSI